MKGRRNCLISYSTEGIVCAHGHLYTGFPPGKIIAYKISFRMHIFDEDPRIQNYIYSISLFEIELYWEISILPLPPNPWQLVSPLVEATGPL